MAKSTDFRYGMLIKYHYFEGGRAPKIKKDYWGIGYVVNVSDKYIKLSSRNPNKAKRGAPFELLKKVKLENLPDFIEILDTRSEDS